jgi:hypothetical protein
MRNGPILVDFDKWRNGRVGFGAKRYKGGAHDLMVIEEDGTPRWLFTPNHNDTRQQLYLFQTDDRNADYLL